MISLRDARVRQYEVAKAKRRGRVAWITFALGIVLAPLHALIPIALIPFAAIVAITAALARSPKLLASGLVQVDRSSVRSAGSVILNGAEVERGVVTSSGMGAQAELTLADGREVHVGAWTWAEAEAVLAELGLDASRRRTQLDLTGESRTAVGLLLAYFAAVPLGVFAVLAYLASPVFFSLLCALAVAVFLGLGALTRPPLVEIGADVVIVRRSTGSESIPLRDIVDVSWTNQAVYLTRAGGKRVVIRGLGASAQAVRAAAARIQQARAVLQASTSPRLVLDALSRRGRDLGAWRRDLGAIVGQGGDYRTRSLEPSDIAQALEAADASPTERAGAAMLLASHADPEMRARVRIALDRAASPKLRVALERIVENADEPAVEAALADAEAEHASLSGHARGASRAG
ncbi:MAG: hypothetical protein JNL21_39435 [Myxococcales bacterium]|nr:hypothetical protein [Myxococcales bacterium]